MLIEYRSGTLKHFIVLYMHIKIKVHPLEIRKEVNIFKNSRQMHFTWTDNEKAQEFEETCELAH